jgi:4-amino-4-deoxy-L-arabinose transferase-like glycosyltransferase
MSTRSLAILALLCSSLLFITLGLRHIDSARDLAFEDTSSYLEGALNIAENGGPFNFLQLCVTGTFKIAEQHPAYLLALSTFASRDLTFFRNAQFFTLAVGLVVVLITFSAGRRLFGEHAAALAALLLSLNSAFLIRSSNVAVETMLMAFMLLAWYFIIQGVTDRRYWAAAGLAAGLAYMTKGTGLFLVPVFVAFTLLHLRWGALRSRHFWLFGVMFILPCLPWIIRNLVVYQTPIYEGLLSHIPWLDSWEQMSDPRSGLMVNWKEHTYSWTMLPTMADYMASHSIAELVERAVTGAKGEAVLLLESLSVFLFPFARTLTGAALLAACAMGIARDIRNARGMITAIYVIAVFVPFAWYHQVTGSNRFIMSLIPVILLYAADTMSRGFQRLGNRFATAGMAPRDWNRSLAAGLAGGSALILAAVLVRYGGVPTVASMQVAQDQEELFSYLRATSGEYDGLLIGPTNRYWGYLWYARYQGKLIPTAGNSPLLREKTVEEFTAFLESRGVNTIVVHAENVSSPRSLQDHFRYSEEEGLSQVRPIAGWQLVHRHSAKPVRFLIFRLTLPEFGKEARLY